MTIRVFEPTFGQPQLIHQPQEAYRLSGSADALEVTPPPIGRILFQDIQALSVYEVRERGAQKICLMVFSYGRLRPFVIDVGNIDYANFPGLAEIPSGMEKFRRLVIFLGQNAAGDTLVDAGTAAFLKTGQVIQIQKLTREPIALASAFASHLAVRAAQALRPAPQSAATPQAVPQAPVPQAAGPLAAAAPPSLAAPGQPPPPPGTAQAPRPAAASQPLASPQAAAPLPAMAPPQAAPSPYQARPSTAAFGGAAQASRPTASVSDDAARENAQVKTFLMLLSFEVFGACFLPWVQSSYNPDVKFSALGIGGLSFLTILAAAGLTLLVIFTSKENLYGVRGILPLITVPGFLSCLIAKWTIADAVGGSSASDYFSMSYGWYATMAGFICIQFVALSIREV